MLSFSTVYLIKKCPCMTNGNSWLWTLYSVLQTILIHLFTYKFCLVIKNPLHIWSLLFAVSVLGIFLPSSRQITISYLDLQWKLFPHISLQVHRITLFVTCCNIVQNLTTMQRQLRADSRTFIHFPYFLSDIKKKLYSHAPHNDVSVNDGPHIRRCPHKIIIL